MTLQLIVAAVNQDISLLPSKMNIGSDAIIINQCEQFNYKKVDYNGHQIQIYCFVEKGVGLNRNNGLLRATADIILFADEDIVYENGYEQMVMEQFEANPKADMILFNMNVAEDRATYHISNYGKVGLHNCGRYPTYSFAVKTNKIRKANIAFSLLFGGGATYSNGEDSLFIRDCLKAGLRVFTAPITIGTEQPRPSTWFHGFNEKFFFDRGVLYVFLYGALAKPMAMRFLLKNKKTMCKEISFKQARKLMYDGIREGKSL